MGVYRTVSRKVEDVFVKILAGKQDSQLVKEKVARYRAEYDEKLKVKKAGKDRENAEQKLLFQQRKEEQERGIN
ncbi:hypothetical protein D1B31_02130 [Neobacillus notoginsengisoli]|uniref:Uncharacterized protein n=1 Tax=Neobacillus notoginsengisoli TaxID=1578198 RepID=A0A417Z0M1_9BACI|nr:hypothetical protein [Neobacillus notoginsengisoli]RHW43478.1 hypothetical protein D1B31_02130 [Neobacillus notoginsengisoli]